MEKMKVEDPDLSKKVMRDIYVDDLTSAVNSVEEGERFYKF